ncbi:unnamed protein product [Amoebophrya sp. A120]|nr:unnamed protein product [Amoebophrya sp. A120]|eukprot:GSA120T00011256001.1
MPPSCEAEDVDAARSCNKRRLQIEHLRFLSDTAFYLPPIAPASIVPDDEPQNSCKQLQEHDRTGPPTAVALASPAVGRSTSTCSSSAAADLRATSSRTSVREINGSSSNGVGLHLQSCCDSTNHAAAMLNDAEIVKLFQDLGKQYETTLTVDLSCASLKNDEQDTPLETQLHLNKGVRLCLNWLSERNFFSQSKNLTLALHPTVYTCDQARRFSPHLGEKTAEMKNLLLKDKKKNLFLLSAVASTKIELKKLKLPGAASGGLGFASSDSLLQALELLPGSVTPFGLLFNRDCIGGEDDETTGSSCQARPKVSYFLDENAKCYDRLAFHPCACHSTLALPVDTFCAFIRECTGDPEVAFVSL